MKSLIIGKGQVGQGLYEVIRNFHDVVIKDIEPLEVPAVKILHICFPYSDKFIEITNEYIDKYRPMLTIVHSSVAIGTTEKINGSVCYSPIRGKHPNLANDIKVFEKFVAGDADSVRIATEYFRHCGMAVIPIPDKNLMRSLEFCKLMANIRYGYEICFMQEAERIALAFGVDMTTFNIFENSYNNGYDRTSQHYLKRPKLYGGYIGGHCIMQNIDILSKQYVSEMFDWMYFSNNKRRVETKVDSI